MDNIDFDEQQFQSRSQIDLPNRGKMIEWLIKRGVVKDERIAGYILLGLTVFFVILTIIIFFTFIKQPAQSSNLEIDHNTDPSLVI